MGTRSHKVLFFANTDWYLFNFQLALIRAVHDSGSEVVLMSPPGKYASRLQAEGFRWLACPIKRRSLNPFSEVALFFRILKIYRQERPDLVHHFTLRCVVAGSFAGIFSGIRRRVNTITGLGHSFIHQRIAASFIRFGIVVLLRLCFLFSGYRIIVQTSDDAQMLRSRKIGSPALIRLIRGSGVDTAYFRSVVPCQIAPQRPFKVLFSGRLILEKGIREYVRAAMDLKKKGLQIEFLVAGKPDPGNPTSADQQEVAAWSREGAVTILGHCEDMKGLLEKMNLFVLPSYREGVSKGILEACACGLPVVATNVPGCREIINHHENGLLVPLGDGQALADAIEYFYDRPQECIRMGEAGRQKVAAEFDIKKVVHQNLQIYMEFNR